MRVLLAFHQAVNLGIEGLHILAGLLPGLCFGLTLSAFLSIEFCRQHAERATGD